MKYLILLLPLFLTLGCNADDMTNKNVTKDIKTKTTDVSGDGSANTRSVGTKQNTDNEASNTMNANQDAVVVSSADDSTTALNVVTNDNANNQMIGKKLDNMIQDYIQTKNKNANSGKSAGELGQDMSDTILASIMQGLPIRR